MDRDPACPTGDQPWLRGGHLPGTASLGFTADPRKAVYVFSTLSRPIHNAPLPGAIQCHGCWLREGSKPGPALEPCPLAGPLWTQPSLQDTGLTLLRWVVGPSQESARQLRSPLLCTEEARTGDICCQLSPAA